MGQAFDKSDVYVSACGLVAGDAQDVWVAIYAHDLCSRHSPIDEQSQRSCATANIKHTLVAFDVRLGDQPTSELFVFKQGTEKRIENAR